MPRKLTLQELTEGIETLLKRSRKLRAQNFFPTEDLPLIPGRKTKSRSVDGSGTNLTRAEMGAAGKFFARNVSPDRTNADPDLLEPDPREVSRALLRCRGDRTEAEPINLLAAAWVQFQVHDWFGHDETEESPLDLDATDGLPRLKLRRTASEQATTPDGTKVTAYRNKQVHWWDGSQIYGNDGNRIRDLRLHEGGKLETVAHNGRVLLPPDPAHPNNGAAPDEKVDLTGFSENWWLGLGLMHNLFVREHNAICDMLAEKHADWSDDRLFNTARLINTALMAKIHTVEWTPALLDDEAAKLALRIDWWGVPPDVVAPLGLMLAQIIRAKEPNLMDGLRSGKMSESDIERKLKEWLLELQRSLGDVKSERHMLDDPASARGAFARFAGLMVDTVKEDKLVALSRFAGSQRDLVKSVFKIPKEDVAVLIKALPFLDEIAKGAPSLLLGREPRRMKKAPRNESTDENTAIYAMTEEFVSVYRMHPLLPEEIRFRPIDGEPEEWPFKDVLFGRSRLKMQEHDLADIANSFGLQRACALTLRNYPKFLHDLRRPGATDDPVDVAAIDILRDRERGVPRYQEFRQAVRTFNKKVNSFADLVDPNHPDRQALIEELRKVYDDKLERVDTMVGLFAEELPRGFAFSDTAFEIFILMAPRRLNSDRFFTDGYTTANYTREGLDWINNRTMVDVLKSHDSADKRLTKRLEELDVQNAFIPWEDVERQQGFRQIPIHL